MTKPKVSLIVTSHNQLHHSKMTYKSLRQNTHYPYELIWVDSASVDGTRDWLNSLDDIMPVFVGNIGVGAAMLEGFARCSPDSKYIGDLDNDIILTDGWLGRLVKHMEENPALASISCRTQLKSIPPYGFKFNKKSFKEDIQIFARKIAKQESGIKLISFVNGCHSLFRRKAIEKIGLWDPRFWFSEDKDLGLRLRQVGWRAALANDTWIYHFRGTTSRAIQRDEPELQKKLRASHFLCKQLVRAGYYKPIRKEK